MQTLYPAIKTYAEHRLAVEDPHELYIEECGNPDGIPIVVLHNGPGTGCEAYHRRFFDPEKYRIVIFDQRGAGRSKPHAELSNNNTQALLKDLETIREYLKIERWAVFGGAWGALLALLYAQSHPDRVIGMVLRSTFLGRQQDINWFYQNGTRLIFPDYWDDFVRTLSVEEQKDVLQTYHKRLTGHDELSRMSTAKSWSLWQARCTSLQPHNDLIDHFSDPRFAVGLAIIESHYFVNHCFIEENQILANMDKIKHIPGYIIHGRYDIVCPLGCAWDLHHAWPSSELYIVRDAGHSPKEPGLIDAVTMSTKRLAKSHRDLA